MEVEAVGDLTWWWDEGADLVRVLPLRELPLLRTLFCLWGGGACSGNGGGGDDGPAIAMAIAAAAAAAAVVGDVDDNVGENGDGE